MRKLLATFAILFLGTIAIASEGDGGYAGAFLRMGMGARAKALGDAFTAIPEDAIAGFYNPALLPHLKKRQAMLSFAFLPLDRKLDYLGYAQALHPKTSEEDGAKPLSAGFAVAWVHAGVDNIYGTDSNGNHLGDFSNSEHAFQLSFAISPAKMFSFGITGKVLYNRFPKIAQEDAAVTSRGFGMDFGAYLTPLNNLMLGVVLHDNMSKYTWNTDKLWERGTSTTYRFPKVTRAAVAYRIPQQWLLAIAEVEDSKEQNPRYHFGVEVSYLEMGALRFGYDNGVPTFGVGFFSKLFGRQAGLNYAFITGDNGLSADHVFSWTFEF